MKRRIDFLVEQRRADLACAQIVAAILALYAAWRASQ